MWLANKTTQDNYFNICRKCINDNSIFDTFKSNTNYNSIVGMSEQWQANVWYNNIKTNYPEINLEKYCLNDKYGSPDILNLDGLKISSNTLRYINTALEIKKYLQLDNINIVTEFGIGYGGLCFVLNTMFKINMYVLLDVDVVQKLAIKYLNLLNVNNITINPQPSDLFISEFCLSEFSEDKIINVFNTQIINAKNIYLMMNENDKVPRERIISLIKTKFEISIKDEYPKTRWPNYLIVGKKHE